MKDKIIDSYIPSGNISGTVDFSQNLQLTDSCIISGSISGTVDFPLLFTISAQTVTGEVHTSNSSISDISFGIDPNSIPYTSTITDPETGYTTTTTIYKEKPKPLLVRPKPGQSHDDVVFELISQGINPENLVLVLPGPDELNPQANSALIPNIMFGVFDKSIEFTGDVGDTSTNDSSM